MRDLPIETALTLIASAGYDGVELALMPEWQCDPAKMSKADGERLRALLRETHSTRAEILGRHRK
jgi:sugar phosphate isomerase/epimerase